ncbi:GntR family transcriptional regulator [Anaerocolumna sedimenticola]|uniref:GntR family transcriptional regulator n=1 Tax=Anaerocolumna sedimenticola TaxID=2696063 RepID=A0A6P1TL76_9FIRM|nr:GntR family transcriptional regulator [Anaerocolumna sedimenticola]QHQ61804.1 GntR family transcriptional regulator [Anaerocolumna sedimenticola]
MEFDNNIPIYIQVINDIKKDIINGALALGEKLPSGRDLAYKYKINPNTANRIYKEMEAEEICYTKRGLGTFVTEDKEKLKNIREEMAGSLLDSFIEGMKQLGFTKEELIHLLEHKYDLNTKQ